MPKNDHLLGGLMKLLDICFQVRPELKETFGSDKENPLVVELFTKGLFFTGKEFPRVGDFRTQDDEASTMPEGYVKAKSSDTRKLAYDLLSTLCIGCSENIKTLIRDGILALYQIIKPKTNQSSYSTGYSAK